MGEMGEEDQVVTIFTQNQNQNSQGDVDNSNFTFFTEWLAAGFTKADLQEEANQDHQDCFEYIKIKTSFCYKTIDSSFSFSK